MSDTYTAAEWAAMHTKLERMVTAELLTSGYVNITKLHRSLYPVVRVVLFNRGERVIQVIKALRTHLPPMGLVAAKECTDRALSGEDPVVLETDDHDAAEALATALREAGAVVGVVAP